MGLDGNKVQVVFSIFNTGTEKNSRKMAEHRGKTQVFFRLPSFVSILQQFSLQSGPFECASLLCLGKSYRAGYVSVGDAPWKVFITVVYLADVNSKVAATGWW